MTTIPNRRSAPYKAAEYLYHAGPKTEPELFTAVSFGSKPSGRPKILQGAITDGWLNRLPSGLIVCSEVARGHFAGEPESASKYVGQVAEPRSINIMHRKPWKSNLNPRGNRADTPDWSHRGMAGEGAPRTSPTSSQVGDE
jgi:hypothetical protein